MRIMQKVCVLVSLMLMAKIGWAQAVILRGTAFDSKGHGVHVEVNDTLRKILGVLPEEPLSKQQKQQAAELAEQGYRLIEEKKYVLVTDSLGRFSLIVRPQDSVKFSAYYHKPQKLAVRDLLRRPQVAITLEAVPCQTYVACPDTMQERYVFIGRKQYVRSAEQPYYCNVISMDSKFAARYRVIKNVANTLPDSVVEFVAYDHYGRPKFSRYETVLLFVRRYCGEYVHQKYQYYPLYKTANGQWAAPVMAMDLAHPDARYVMKPRKIRFATPVEIDVAGIDPERLKELYPAPYYHITDEKAIAEYGNYVEELARVKKRTALKGRKIKL